MKNILKKSVIITINFIVFSFLFSYIFANIFGWLNLSYSSNVDKKEHYVNTTTQSVDIWSGISHYIVSANIEEIIFRFFPIFLLSLFTCTNVSRLYEDKYRMTLFVGILSSVCFGYLHGNWCNIFIQGISGYLMFEAFIRFNETLEENNVKLNNTLQLILGLVFTTIIHCLYNTFLSIPSMIAILMK